MQRYTVTLFSPGTLGDARPTLLVPCEPSIIVTAFVEELYRRIARQGIALAPNTHIATLHVDSESGAIIDCEDVLGDVLPDPGREKIVAVFTEKQQQQQRASTGTNASGTNASETRSQNQLYFEPSDNMLSVRLITPAVAQSGNAAPILQIPASATVKQLHQLAAQNLQTESTFNNKDDSSECNCNLARELTDLACPPGHIFVVHGKSQIDKLELPSLTEAGVKACVLQHLDVELETKKKLQLFGGEKHTNDATTYKKPPIAAVCSKLRHTPAHARTIDGDADQVTGSTPRQVLDLHTCEIPIHQGCMDATLEQAGLPTLAVDGIINIFAVTRASSGSPPSAPLRGQDSIYHASHLHWQPPVKQSERGVAMFLSSLRVFASNVQKLKDEAYQDAVLHVWDLLTKYPPSVRALSVLINGNTPTSAECTVLASTAFTVLDRIVPEALIGTDHTRVFEGARLLFGFVLEKARSLKLPETEDLQTLPYLGSLKEVDLTDCITSEGVINAVQVADGLLENALFNALSVDGVLHGIHPQSGLTASQADMAVRRLAVLSGGANPRLLAFSPTQLAANYRYPDNGQSNGVWDDDELSTMEHLSEHCSRNKLVVHMPTLLAGEEPPCLTFDRNGRLAVYTGQEGCGADPSKSTLMFRPSYGTEGVDVAVIEQLIAEPLQASVANGTAVFDALGGAQARRLQNPDEIIMVVVDVSASMRTASEWAEVNDNVPTQPESAVTITEPEYYNRNSFDDVKESLTKHESFADMVAIVGESPLRRHRQISKQVLDTLRAMLGDEIIHKHKDLESRRGRAGANYHLRRDLGDLQSRLEQVKSFWACLQTYEEAACDFLLYRATTEISDGSLDRNWRWTLGETAPAGAASNTIPSLPASITEVEHELMCPISHTLMQDCVTSVDQFSYSRSAITTWFNNRHSSPMTGLALSNISLTQNTAISDAAGRWIAGNGIVSTDSTRRPIRLTFVSAYGTFDRSISSSTTLSEIYQLAFRGMNGRYSVFQLMKNNIPVPTGAATASQQGVVDGDRLGIRIADEGDMGSHGVSPSSRADHVLIKVYSGREKLLFAYWVKRDDPSSVSTIIWKYWRNNRNHLSPSTLMKIWNGLDDDGDSRLIGYECTGTESLIRYFNEESCFGRFGTEPVCRERQTGEERDATQPLVFKVQIQKVKSCEGLAQEAKLTRLDVLKQMFEALINRLLAYNIKAHVGLVTVASKATPALPISHILENFRRAVTDMYASGDTALWDALALANDQLIEYAVRFPEARKRIVCISDGADTKSLTQTAHGAYWLLRQNNVALDSICLGNEENADLRTVSYLLGCYRFHPASLENALAICEMEPFLSVLERPDLIAPTHAPRNATELLPRFRNAKYHASYTVANDETVPPRKEHANQKDEFVMLTSATAARRNTAAGGSRHRANLRITRLMREMTALASTTHATYDVYVSETDMSFWKVVMVGPDGSPYRGGTFLLYVHADESYPTFAPKSRFLNPVKHPNVNVHGLICHSIFSRDWTTDTSMSTLLDTVYGLLLQPEVSDPVNTTATLGYHHDQVEYNEQVRDFVQRHAQKSRSQWKTELTGDDGDEWEDEGMEE